MQYSIQYQIMESGDSRPQDCSQDDVFLFDNPAWLPSVGDSVSMKYDERIRAFIVLSRHFSISSPKLYLVNIVVREATIDEICKRIEE